MDDSHLLPAPDANTGENTGPEVIPPRRPGIENLRKPWEKGQSGNPRGRPKSKPLTDALRRIGGKKVTQETLDALIRQAPNIQKVLGKRPTYFDLLAYSMIQQGIRGQAGSGARIFERIEGRVVREIQETGEDDRLDELMEVLTMAPAAPGETNDDE